MADNETSKKLIVLVEDEEIMANLLVAKLEKAGYAVALAKDGQEGLALIHERVPDLVLLDMLLPKINGFGVLERLQAEKLLPKLPVIIVSNSGQPVEIERAMKLGVRDYLIKVNFDPNEVLTLVNRVLRPGETATARRGGADDGARRATEDATARSASGGKNVLVIEDDVFLADLLQRKFSQKNYKVLRAPDVEGAWRVLAENPIDLILLDIVLPGVHGWTFLEELKADAKFKDIPVVIISNLGQREEIEKGLKAGAADYIVKAHATPDEILEKVESILKK